MIQDEEVALRKESVDRNIKSVIVPTDYYVALRKESVDRNLQDLRKQPVNRGRSPQGERG